MKAQKNFGAFRKKILCALPICLIFLVFGLITEARAATYYVATDGNDSWPGTINQPWKTINHAAQILTPGDTVLVRGGTYNVGSSPSWDKPAVNPQNSGTEANPITFKSYPGETVILTGTGSGGLIGSYYKDHIIWDGFTVVMSGGMMKGILIFYADGCVVQNCIIEGNTVETGDNHDGIRIEGTSGTVVRNCTIKDVINIATNPWNGAGIKYYYNSNALVENCEIFNCSTGIFDKDKSHNHIYRGNYIHDCSRVGVLLHTQAGHTSGNAEIYENIVSNCNSLIVFSCDYDYSNVEIYNNVIYTDSSKTGIKSELSPNLQIWNNIIYTRGYALLTHQGGFPTYSDYNCFYPEAKFRTGAYTGNEEIYTNLGSWQSGTGFDLNSINQDPMFVDPENGDFHLHGNSPCRGAGKDGLDMGAYPRDDGTIIGPIPDATEDATAPSVSNTLPASGAADVPVDSNISFGIQDSGDGVDINSLQLTVSSEQISKENLQITGDSSDYMVVYDPPADFGYDSVTTVSIDAQDLHDPANVMNTYTIPLPPRLGVHTLRYLAMQPVVITQAQSKIPL